MSLPPNSKVSSIHQMHSRATTQGFQGVRVHEPTPPATPRGSRYGERPRARTVQPEDDFLQQVDPVLLFVFLEK